MAEGSLIAVTVVGNDRPGIVAAVSRVLFETSCNLEDVTSTILRGHFSMVMIVRAHATAGDLEAKLIEAGRDMGLQVTVRPVDEVEATIPDPTHMVSVYGADKPGIVYRVAGALAAIGANITDLTSRVIGESEHPVYALMLEVSSSPGTDISAELDGLKEDLGVEISVHELEVDVL